MKRNFNYLILSVLIIINQFSYAQVREKNQASLVKPCIAARSVTVGKTGSDFQGFESATIQAALDYVSKTGGIVKLSEGNFSIKSPLRVGSNTTLSGEGPKTVLKKGKGFQSHFTTDADYGELKIETENANGFEVGMKIQVTDNEQISCWNVSTAYVTAIDNNIIYIDKGLIRDYRSDKNGLVSNASSVIDILDVENVVVKKLQIDGNRSENFFADGCNNAGILIMRSAHVTVDSVKVLHFNGEGISWQITENVTVKNSEIAWSGNMGLHPGTGSPYTKILNNSVHNNDKDGLYVCWRVYNSEISGNSFFENGRYGICTGHKDTDSEFTRNHIYKNQSDGINLRGEREINAPHRVTFSDNLIEDNNGYGISIQSKASGLTIRNNTFKSNNKKQLSGIYIYKSGIKPSLEGNIFDAHPKGNVTSEL